VRDEFRGEAIDPRLVQDREGRWRPAPDSPVVGAATGFYPEVTVDIDGQARPARKDAGCDQQSTAPVLFSPASEADAGPVWRSPGTRRQEPAARD